MKNEITKIENNFINVFGENSQNAIILGDIASAPTEEKIKFYNEVLDSQITVDMILEKEKTVKYIHVDKVDIKNQNDSGTHEAPRIVFYFEDGTSCISFSAGIYLALKKLVNVFGAPPYKFNIKFRSIEKGKTRTYTINIMPKK